MAYHPLQFAGLVATRLHPPRPRAGALTRPDLLRRLEEADTALVLIDAPAGWGKSTLLATWHDSTANPDRLAYYAAESSDNDASVFWAYVLAAVARVERDAAGEARALLAAGASVRNDVVPALLNGLLHAAPLALLIEDYHVIDNPAIHEAMSYLVEHLPSGDRVVLTSRAEPPFSIGRLRARGEVLEVGLDDLRFDLDECRSLLETELGQPLAAQATTRLAERTEGWPAGLHLAALSLRGRPGVDSLVDRFAGDNRLVVDYLASEVLDRLDPDVRTFLQQTSVLERFSPGLCDAVLGSAPGTSARLIDQIEREQLFLIPLDDRREWYRYHHLFADLLRGGLARDGEPVAHNLRRRAARWFADQNLLPEAISHALDGRDHDLAARLLGERYFELLNEGQADRLVGWFEQLPLPCYANGELALARAVCLLNDGRPNEVERWLTLAEAGATDRRPIAGWFPNLASGIASIRGHLAYVTGDLGQSERWTRMALAAAADGAPGTFVNSFVLGAACYHRGEHDGALHWLERDRQWAVEFGSHVLTLITEGFLAGIALAAGDLVGTERLLDRSRATAEGHQLDQHWSAARRDMVRANLLARQGHLDDAVTLMRAALELSHRGHDRLLQLELLRALAGLERQAGDPLATHRESEARRLAATCPDPGPLSAWLLRPATPDALPDGLTDRQAGVLRLVAEGLSDAEVAARLGLSERTVHAHLRNIYAKIGVKGRTAATRYAVDRHLV